MHKYADKRLAAAVAAAFFTAGGVAAAPLTTADIDALEFKTVNGVSIRVVREGLVREAVGEYLKIRKDWAEVGFWEDVHLGDPDFFREAVLPLIERLDPPADRVVKGIATPEEIEAYQRDFVADWADFRLALGRLRAAWLEEGFFR